MTRRFIDWDNLETDIYTRIANGENLKAIAKAVGVSYNAMLSWYRKSDTRRRYDAFLNKTQMPDRRRDVIFKVTPADEKTLPRFQRKWLVFKDKLKVGDRIKHTNFNVKGVVVAKYPHIFTIRSDDDGCLTSFGYNDFMHIEIKGAKA